MKAFISSLWQEQPKITGCRRINFEYRVSEMKNISNRNAICQKIKVSRVHCCDIDVNYVAAHVNTSGFWQLTATKAVFIYG